MARPTAQVLTLLELLQSGGVRTMAELADRLSVDPRTVRRYVGHLIDLDVPVESVRGRYGGYRLAPGYRLPPLMLSDDEALAVLLGLTAARRSGLTASSPSALTGAAGPAAASAANSTVSFTAAETAAAKIRRVLPTRLAAQLDALLESLAFTSPYAPASSPSSSSASPPGSKASSPSSGSASPPGSKASSPSSPAAAPSSAILLTLADAVRHHRPVAIRYTGGHRSDRTLHPYGLVSHNARWYVTGLDTTVGDDRTFRLDRIADARTLPGSFEPPPGIDPAQRVLDSLAAAPYSHEVTLRIQGTAAQIRTRLPAGVAAIHEGDPWCRVDIHAESLDWIPRVLAHLDLPFAIDRPTELRDLVNDLATRLKASADRT
jgi:predicted DNA-binding transcriptional regulator YafY